MDKREKKACQVRRSKVGKPSFLAHKVIQNRHKDLTNHGGVQWRGTSCTTEPLFHSLPRKEKRREYKDRVKLGKNVSGMSFGFHGRKKARGHSSAGILLNKQL